VAVPSHEIRPLQGQVVTSFADPVGRTRDGATVTVPYRWTGCAAMHAASRPTSTPAAKSHVQRRFTDRQRPLRRRRWCARNRALRRPIAPSKNWWLSWPSSKRVWFGYSLLYRYDFGDIH